MIKGWPSTCPNPAWTKQASPSAATCTAGRRALGGRTCCWMAAAPTIGAVSNMSIEVMQPQGQKQGAESAADLQVPVSSNQRVIIACMVHSCVTAQCGERTLVSYGKRIKSKLSCTQCVRRCTYCHAAGWPCKRGLIWGMRSATATRQAPCGCQQPSGWVLSKRLEF